MRLNRAAGARPSLLLAALRWRLGLSATVLLCATVVLAGAALGPLFARAVKENALRDTLLSSQVATQIHLQGHTANDQYETMREAQERVDAAERVPVSPHYTRSVASLQLVSVGSAGAQYPSGAASVVWRQGACGQVRMVAGRCPDGPGEAMVSARASDSGFGWRLGGPLAMETVPPDPYGFGTATAPLRLRVVGVYQPRDTRSAYWAGAGYFRSGQALDNSAMGTTSRPAATDAVLVTRATFRRLPAPSLVRGAVDRSLDVSSIRLADVPTLRAEVARDLRINSQGEEVAAATRLPAVLDRAADEGGRIDAATLLIILQLCVLGWLVLFQVLVDAIEARSADIALAKLRGFSRRQVLQVGLAEPLALLAIAVPLGLAIAYGAAVVLTAVVMRPGTPVLLSWPVGLALLGAFAGGAAAVVLSARRALTRSVLEQWRRTRTVQRAGRGLLLDGALAAAGLIAFVGLLLLGPAAGALVLVGPGLLILAVALAGARLLPLALRPLLPATAGGRRLALFLAARQVVRRPAGLRLVALLTMAVGLATFGVAGQSIAVANRVARANAELGAPRVQRIDVALGEDPIAAVRKADPAGRWAAATASWLPFGGDVADGTLVAVDGRHVAAVAADARGLPAPDDLRRATVGSAPAPIRFSGRSIAVTATLSGLRGGPAPQVRFDLRRTNGRTFAVESTSLKRGRGTYRAVVPCAAGCSLDGVSWVRSIFADGTVAGSVLVTDLAVDGHRLAAGIGSGEWAAIQAEDQAVDHVTTTGEGVLDRFSIETGQANGIRWPAVPYPIPALATLQGIKHARVGAGLVVQDPSGEEARLRVSEADPVLPVVLTNGVVLDATALQAALPTFSSDATWTVWMSRSAPPDALARLRAAGLRLDGPPVTVDARVAAYARESPALALLLLAVTAVLGALLAIGGTTVSIGAAVRRRSYEAAALGAIGVGRRTVRRAALVEQLLLLGTAVVVGVPAGLLTVLLALPLIPQTSRPTPVPAINLPPVLPLVVSTLVLAALVVLAGALAARHVVRAGGAERLREAEE